MSMSDRQFAAAHDKLLEPPDITDDESEDDEMTLASIYKQQQRDWEDYQAEIYRQKKEDEQ